MTFKPGDKPKVITSAKQLATLSERGRYRDPATKGLYLAVAHENNRSWVLRYQIDGKAFAMGLGPYPLFGLKEARDMADDIHRAIRRDGINPLEQRKAKKEAEAAARAKAQTFRQAAERFLAKAAPEWKGDAQARAFASQMQRYAYPLIGDMGVAAIDTQAVLSVLQPIWTDKPTVADMLRFRIEKVLTMATVGGFRTGDNPARWKGHLSEMLPSHGALAKQGVIQRGHHAAIPYDKLPAFMAALREQASVTARALEYIILTASRLQEGLQARWGEIDLEARLWTIPAKRHKTGGRTQKPHVVPLSDAAMALLLSLPAPREDGDFVFPGRDAGKPLSPKPVATLGERFCDVKITTHGFRSAFRDWAGDKTEFPREVIEAALAHTVGSASERAYRRGTGIEKRAELMQAWADFCGGVQPGDSAGDSQAQGGKVVVPFRARR